jgi:hypothetical protein
VKKEGIVGPHAETLRPSPRPRRPHERRAQRDVRANRPTDEPGADLRGSPPPTDEPDADRSGSPPQIDHGVVLLSIFTASVLLVVALVVIAGAVGQMWILAPIMVVDFAVTAAVLVTVAKLLEDSSA